MELGYKIKRTFLTQYDVCVSVSVSLSVFSFQSNHVRTIYPSQFNSLGDYTHYSVSFAIKKHVDTFPYSPRERAYLKEFHQYDLCLIK